MLLQIKVKYFKGFKAWSAFGSKVAEKARRNSEHPNTRISHRLRNDKCVGFGAKLTLTADQPRTPNHVSIEFLFNGCS